jgi:uncharacterized membrane protein YdbT with pleckstrin-like domain
MSTSDITVLVENTYYKLGSKTFWYIFGKQSITGFVFLFVALLLSMSHSYFLSNPEMASSVCFVSWVVFCLAIIALIIALIYSKLRYKNTGFTLSPNALLLRRGVIKKEEFAIPYRQIQNIETERTLFDQMLGVSKFIILTAGEENEKEKVDEPENILPMVDKDIALLLQAELLKRNNVQKVTW